MRGGGPQGFPGGGFPGGIPLGSQVVFQQPGYPPPKGEFGAPVEKDYYSILEVPVTASKQDIQKAFRNLSRQHHPDKGGDTKRYQKMTEAHSILSDPEKRACYDAYGAEYEKVPNIQLFVQQLRAEDQVMHVKLSMKDCIHGTHLTIPCRVRDNDTWTTQTLSVNVPANVEDGHQLVFHDVGHKVRGKLPGNVVVIVHEEPTPEEKDYRRFGGSDGIILTRQTITLAQAVCGNPVEIYHPNGTTVSLQHEVLKPEQWYRIEGQKPEMYVSFAIQFPEELDLEQRDKLRQVFGVSEIIGKDRTHVQAVQKEELDHRVTTVRQRMDEERRQAGSVQGVQECPVQ